MLNGKKIVVVLPAYNAAQTLESTYSEIPFDIVDEVVLVDDASRDDTVSIAQKLQIHHIIVHEKTRVMAAIRKAATTKPFPWMPIS